MDNETIHVDMSMASRPPAPGKVLTKVGTSEDIRAVYSAWSQSDPTVRHFVIVFADGRGIQCSCQGFKYQGRCWHAQSVPLCLEPASVDQPIMVCGFVKDHPGKHDFEYMRQQ